MATLTAPVTLALPSEAVTRIPAGLAFATAAAGLVYTISLVIFADPVLASTALMVGGLLAVPVLLALAKRLLSPSASLGLRSGLVLALIAAIGSTLHGAYDLAVGLHPPIGLAGDLPNPVDPRGVLTFGVAGLALLTLGLASHPVHGFPTSLSIVAAVNGSLMIMLYVARLVVVDPSSAFVVGPTLLAGFVSGPAWFLGLGLWFLRANRPRPRRRLGRFGIGTAW